MNGDLGGQDFHRGTVQPWAEQRPHPVGELVGVGEEMAAIACIPEGHLTLLHVKLDTDNFRPAVHFQLLSWCGESAVDALAQADGPQAAVSGDCELALACNRLFADTQDPLGVVTNVNIPAVSSGTKALRSQREHTWVEALQVVWEGLSLLVLIHTVQLRSDA